MVVEPDFYSATGVPTWCSYAAVTTQIAGDNAGGLCGVLASRFSEGMKTPLLTKLRHVQWARRWWAGGVKRDGKML